jgi:uncharacterized protein (AIM24 family)
MTIHGSLFQEFREKESQDPFALQNKKLLRIDMRYGEVWARTGSMVAYQGDVRFVNKGSGGLGKMLKAAATGEGVKMMQCSGTGELFVQWDIHRIQARGATMTGGLYNVALRGTGYVAVTTKGDPIALDVASSPTFADAQAVVLWTAGVSMDIRVDTGGIGSMVRGGTGELLQMAFGGQGFVLVQPSESVPQGGHQAQSPGSMLGGFLQ